MRMKLLMSLVVAALIGSPGIAIAAQDPGNASEPYLYRNDQPHPHAQPPKGSVLPDRVTDHESAYDGDASEFGAGNARGVGSDHLYKNSQVSPHAYPRGGSVLPERDTDHESAYDGDPPAFGAGNSTGVGDDHLYKNSQVSPHAAPHRQYPVPREATTSVVRDTSVLVAPVIIKDQMVGIGNRQIAMRTLIGQPALTPEGDKLGIVANVFGQAGHDKNLVLQLDRENTQTTIDLGEPERGTHVSASEPVVVGGSIALVAADRVHPAGDGESIVIERSSLRTTDREARDE